MMDEKTYLNWRESAFYYLKQKFSNVNESILECAISEAYTEMWLDRISEEPHLSFTKSTLKHVAKCRTIDALRKYRLELSTETLPNSGYFEPDSDDFKDDLIQKAIEMKSYLNPREQVLMEEKFKIKDYSNMSSVEIQDFRNQKASDEVLKTIYNYPSTGAVRAERRRGLARLMAFFQSK